MNHRNEIRIIELENGSEIYIQSSLLGDIMLSFDNRESQFMHRVPVSKVQELIDAMQQVIGGVKSGIL